MVEFYVQSVSNLKFCLLFLQAKLLSCLTENIHYILQRAFQVLLFKYKLIRQPIGGFTLSNSLLLAQSPLCYENAFVTLEARN